MLNDKINEIKETNSGRKIQRALVLQGGVALGAYEAGVFKTLSERLKEEDEKNGIHRPLFDIVAGTSAGAINAAIIVSYVKANKTWQGAGKVLEEFWSYLASPTPFIAKFYGQWFGEAARRYYSTKYFFYQGIENVFSSPSIMLDNTRFLDFLPFFNGLANVTPNTWYQYFNGPLRESLQAEYENHRGEKKKFVKFPIATTYDEHPELTEPRLLTISVDVKQGTAVTFDSYYNGYDEKGKPIRRTIYGDPNKPVVMKYDDGIRLEHVMASGSFPVHFKYQEIDGRQFWDGGLLSNTPLRELMQAHRNYWKDVRNEQTPDLDVYVVNVWPTTQRSVPTDYDGVKDRKNDIVYCDKTDYDQKVAIMVGDYIDLFNEIKELAIKYIDGPHKRTEFAAAVKKLLNGNIKNKLLMKPRSKKRSGRARTYGDLIYRRFKLNKVVTIERVDDPNSISNKWADFTTETIEHLIKEGENYEKIAIIKTF